jgi:hypothetical protein
MGGRAVAVWLADTFPPHECVAGVTKHKQQTQSERKHSENTKSFD